MVASSLPRSQLSAVAALVAVLASAAPGSATCDPTSDPDRTDIANARAAVAANYDCTGATGHGAYVSCATQQANAVLTNQSCGRFVRPVGPPVACGGTCPPAMTCRLDNVGSSMCPLPVCHCVATP